MSMRTRLSTLESRFKRRIVAVLYQNGCSNDDVTMLLKNGTLSDITDYVDLEEIFY